MGKTKSFNELKLLSNDFTCAEFPIKAQRKINFRNSTIF